MITTSTHPSLGQVILASAGTGKTFALTGEMIARLHDSAHLHAAAGHAAPDPARTLAITFTRKAAAEIRERLLRRLAQAALDPAEAGRLAKHIDRSIDAPGAAALLAGLVARLNRLAVSTIDAHMLRLAGAFALELPVAPGWSIAPDERLADQRAAALSAAIGDAPADERPSALDAVIDALTPGRAPRAVLAAVEKVLVSAHACWVTMAGRPGRAEIWEVCAPPADGSAAPLDPPTLAATIERLKLAPDALKKNGEPKANFIKARTSLALLATSAQWSELLQSTFVARALAGEPYSLDDIPTPTRELAITLARHAAAVLRARLHARNLALRTLTQRFDQQLAALKLASGHLGFVDVPALILAAGLHAPARLGDAFYRLDARVDHALLDEFQDTSLDQFRLLEPMLAEILAGGTGAIAAPRSVLVVGDEKQSLYAWRGAEPELLASLAHRWPQLATRSLDASYRSAPQVLGVVNAVFGVLREPALRTATALDLPSVATMGANFRTHVGAPPAAALKGLVRLVELPPQPPAAATSASSAPADRSGDLAACRAAAERARALLDAAAAAGRQPPTIAVLLRENKLIPRVIAELTHLRVDAIQEAGSPLTDSAAVQAVLSVLDLASSPANEYALYHAGFSVVGRALGLAQPTDRADRPWRRSALRLGATLRRRAADEGPAAVVRRIVARTLASTSLGSFDTGRLAQLVEVAAAAQEAEPGLDLDALARVVRGRAVLPPPPPPADTGSTAPPPPPVRVMTIHASKGLEFDAVILPRLESKWSLVRTHFIAGRSPAPTDAPPDPTADLTWATLTPDAHLAAVDPQLHALRYHALDRHVSQELCGLYVALTRAKLVLEIIVNPPPKEASASPSAARLLRHTLAPATAQSPTAALAPAVLWSAGDDRWTDSLPASTHPPAPVGASDPDRPLSLRVSAAGSAHPRGLTLRAARVSPSALEGTAGLAAAPADDSAAAALAPPDHDQDLSFFESADDPAFPSSADADAPAGLLSPVAAGSRSAAARRRGTLIHALFELVDWLDDGTPTPPSPTGAADAESAQVLAQAELTWRSSLAGEPGRVLRREYYAHRPGRPEALRERSFAIFDPQSNAIVAGAIDRLVIGRDAQGRALWADVVDFKTDQPPASPHPAALAQRAEFYAPQVRAYARAVARGLNLDPALVSARLVFTQFDAVVEIPPN